VKGLVDLDPNRNTKKKKTYLYVGTDQISGNRELFVTSKGSEAGRDHAEDVMIDMLSPNLPSEFWLKNSPCVVCTHTLINAYNRHGPRGTKTIYVMHFFHRSLHCILKES